MNRLLCFLSLVLLVSGARLINNNNNSPSPSLGNVQLIGGIDSHGCITGAGYRYCNYTESCHHFDKPCLFNIVPEIPCIVDIINF